MPQRVRDVLLRIRGDASDAQQELREVATDLKRFDGITATAKVDLQTKAGEVKLERLQQQLKALQARPTEPKIDIAIGRTVAQIERVERELDKLDRRRVDIDIDVDRHGLGRGLAAGAGAVAGGIGVAVQGISGLVAAATRGIPILGNLGAMLVSLGVTGAALGPIFLVLVPIIGIFLLNAVVMLTGAVVALGASFLTAAAGVGVLGVALAGAFGPVVLVAIAAMARFAKILEAVKAVEDNAANSAQRHKDALEAKRTALEAQQTAAEGVEDAIRGIAAAELSREQAHLGVEQAELALKQFRQEAGLASDSLDDLFRKFTDVSFKPESLIKAIRGSALGAQAGPGDELQLAQLILNVKQARLGEQAAIDGVTDAHERLRDAREAESRALEKQNDALEKQDDKLKGLTKTERDLVDVIVSLKKALTEAFRPATDRIFRGVIAFFGDLADFARDRRVRGGLTAIGEAIGDMFREFGRVLRQRQTREAFAELARGGARLIRTLTPVFTSLFNLVTSLAQVALPWLIELVGKVGDAIRGWADDIDRGDLEGFVRRVRRSFNIWVGIARELWGILKALFGGANKDGDEFAEHLRLILRRWRLWLEKNPDAIKQFFHDAAGYGERLADAMEDIAAALNWMINAKDDIADVFDKITNQGRGFDPKRFGTEQKPWWMRALGLQTGGPVPGIGVGDRIPLLAEPGEFMIRRSVAQAVGIGRLSMFNRTGNIAALSAGGGGINIEKIVLPPAPGHGQLGDPRHQAVQLARELRRRGGQTLPGGGIR